jgi:hypothetical protein
MNLLNKCFVLKLIPTANKDIYTIERILKKGNDPLFNKLFSWFETVGFKRLEPSGGIDDYIIFPITFGKRDDQQIIMLETALFLYPFGTVNIGESEDCILFRISEENIVEIFISEGNANMTAQLLTMLVDGELADDINNLLKQQ